MRWGQVDGTASVGAMSQPPAPDSARPPVVVVGQVARDLVLVVDEVPGPGGTVDVEQRRELLGGKGANIAVGLTLAGHPIPDDAAARAVAAELLNRGPDLVVVAVGTDGNLVAWPEGGVLIPLIEPDAVVDTTGGGDAFVAALTWALDRGEDPVHAGQLATTAAGLVVRHPGGRPAMDAGTVEAWSSRLGANR